MRRRRHFVSQSNGRYQASTACESKVENVGSFLAFPNVQNSIAVDLLVGRNVTDVVDRLLAVEQSFKISGLSHTSVFHQI